MTCLGTCIIICRGRSSNPRHFTLKKN